MPLLSAAFLTALLAAGASGAPAEDVLEPGVAVAARLPRGEGRWRAAVEVPPGTRRIHVMTASRQNVDVVLSKDDSWTAESPSGEEHLTLDAPAPGRWNLRVDHPASARGGASFEVCVLLEGDGSPAVLTPGAEAASIGAGGAVAWLPLDTATWSLQSGGAGAGARLRAVDRLGERSLVLGPGSSQVARLPGLLRLGFDEPPSAPVTLEVTARTAESPPPLRPGVETEIELGGDRGQHADFRIVVPEGVPGLEIRCVGDPGSDFDLYARREAPAQGEDEADDAYSMTTGSDDVLRLGGARGVEPGTWHLRVKATDEDVRAGATLLLAPRTRRETVGSKGGVAPPILRPGAWLPGRLVPDEDGTAWFSVPVPRGATRMNVQVVEATSDVEVIVADGAHGRIRAREISERIDERLSVDLQAAGLVGDLPVAVGVVNPLGDESEVRFRVGVDFDRDPALPPDLPMPPYPVPADANDLERAAMAVVEVVTRSGEGSGVCVSPRGILLTARHVIEDDDKPGAPLQRTGILVSFPYDRGRPPRQTHLAVLVAEDAASDLAVLRITGDVYGRPLAADVALPWLPLDPTRKVGLGDTLWVLGYPGVGSERSRTPVIVVRGVVSGVESDLTEPPWIKTDAHISAGHSGGPVLDRDHQLIGIANATLGKYDQLGLVRPLTALPPAWRAWVQGRSSRGALTPPPPTR